MVAAILSFMCKKIDSEDIDDEEKLENALAASDEDLADTSHGPVLTKRKKVNLLKERPFGKESFQNKNL